jgi:hypothetical protein
VSQLSVDGFQSINATIADDSGVYWIDYRSYCSAYEMATAENQGRGCIAGFHETRIIRAPLVF